MADLTLAKANTIIATAIAKGQELGMKPLSVAVVDTGGHLIAFGRSDGAPAGRFKVADGKANAAVQWV